MNLGLNPTQPFHPLLGETMQAKIDDTNIYLEQTSQRPSHFNFYMLNKDYKGYGFYTIDITAGTNSLQIETLGKYNYLFNDGTKYNIKVPGFKVTGLTFGTRYVNYTGNIVIEDLVSEILKYIE